VNNRFIIWSGLDEVKEFSPGILRPLIVNRYSLIGWNGDLK
jgi:hypothetical protein